MKKNHAKEVNGQIANSLLTGEWDFPPPPQSQDLSKIIAESRTSGSEEPKELDEYWPQQIEEGITPQRPLR